MDDLEERIRERAHALWLAEGQPDGRADAHWQEARRQIEAETAAPQNPAAGNPVRRKKADSAAAAPRPEDDVKAIGADAAANAAITGVPIAAGARRRQTRPPRT